MRTLVDLEEAQVKALDEVAEREKRSRAALIRQAIEDFLAKRRKGEQEEAFGLWGEHLTDGIVYQDRVRSEW